MSCETGSNGCLVGLDDCFERQKHGDHAGSAAANYIAAVLQAKGKDGWVNIFRSSNHGVLSWLTVQMAKEESELLLVPLRFFLRLLLRSRIGL